MGIVRSASNSQHQCSGHVAHKEHAPRFLRGRSSPIRRPMIILTKMTARYVPHEDRIALTADGGQDGVVRLWLIRPLTEKLVSALAETIKPSHEDPGYADVIDAFAQSSAEERHKPVPPVEFATSQKSGVTTQSPPAGFNPDGGTSSHGPQPGEPASSRNEWLVREINLKVLNDSYALTFAGTGRQEARCGFTEELLRQWLGILRRVCQTAGWTSPDWPDWMRESVKTEDSPSSLH